MTLNFKLSHYRKERLALRPSERFGGREKLTRRRQYAQRLSHRPPPAVPHVPVFCGFYSWVLIMSVCVDRHLWCRHTHRLSPRTVCPWGSRVWSRVAALI